MARGAFNILDTHEDLKNKRPKTGSQDTPPPYKSPGTILVDGLKGARGKSAFFNRETRTKNLFFPGDVDFLGSI